MFRKKKKKLFYGVGLLAPAQPRSWRTVPCLRLLIQYIRSYLPYPETVSSVQNTRTRLVVVMGYPLNTVLSLRNNKSREKNKIL
jgi:hypothetical protein